VENFLFLIGKTFGDTSFMNNPIAIMEAFVIVFVSFGIGFVSMFYYNKERREQFNKEKNAIRKEINLNRERVLRLSKEKDEIAEHLRNISREKVVLEDNLKEKKEAFNNIFNELNKEKMKSEENREKLVNYENLLKELDEYKKLLEESRITQEEEKQQRNKLLIQMKQFQEDNDAYKKQNKRLKDFGDVLKAEQEKLEENFSKEKKKYEEQKFNLEQEIKRLKIKANEYINLEKQKIKQEQEKYKQETQNLKKQTEDFLKLEKEKLLESIGYVSEQDKEDLRQIRGIGNYIEDKLNKIGIYTIRQISSLKNDDINRAESLIKYFPGRIKRDKWISQAREIIIKRDQIVKELRRDLN
jgi:predicted flap endonuclease-1-like 5' DNA nuclease/cbb3-type cytochrome oxidase subunit 3